MKKNMLIAVLVVVVLVLGFMVWKNDPLTNSTSYVPVQTQTSPAPQATTNTLADSTGTVTSLGGHITVKNIQSPLAVTSNQNNVVIVGEAGFNGPTVVGEYNNVPYMQIKFFENQSPTASLCDFLNQVAGLDTASFGVMTTVNGYKACAWGDSAYVVSNLDGKNIAGFVLPTQNKMLPSTPQDYEKLIPYFKQVLNSVTFN